MRSCTYFGNPWIGLFAATNNEITLVPIDFSEKIADIFQQNLKTQIIRTTIGETNLHGLYVAMNSNGIILPNIITEAELSSLKKVFHNVYVSQDKQNAHGNNIVVNDKGGMINCNVSTEEKKKIQDTLGVELVEMRIAGYPTVGSSCIATNNGFLAHYAVSEDDIAKIKSILKVPGSKGTVNLGTGFVSLGVIANNKGYVAGEKTTAFEMGRVEDGLGFLDQQENK